MLKKTSFLASTVTAISLLATGSALAALTAAGPVNSTAPGSPFPADGLPNWYQDANGVTLQGCLDNTPLGSITPMCVLPVILEEDYNLNQPIAFNGGLTGVLPPVGPTAGINGGIVNFPSEVFYYYASTDPKGTLLTASSDFTVLMVVEGTFLNTLATTPPKSVGNPRPRNGDQMTFQRIRVDINNPPVSGVYTLTYPWGTIQFPCTAGTVICKSITNIPVAAGPAGFLANPDPALGTGIAGSIGPFMVPTTPPVTNASGNQFIGNPNSFVTATVPNCPTCNKDVNGLSFIRIDGPAGSGISVTTNTFSIAGQQFGMDVTPRLDTFPATLVNATSAAHTYTVTNVDTANSLVFPAAPNALVLKGANPGDFTITADTCSGATLLPAVSPPAATSKCTFSVTFNPHPILPTEKAVREAQVEIGVATPASFPKGHVNFSGTAQYPVTALAGTNGAITGAAVTALKADAGSTPVYTVTPNSKWEVKEITVNGSPATFTRPSNPTQPVVFTAPALTGPQDIAATFMPSGNLTGSGTLGANDALKALKILLGLQTPTGDDLTAMKVYPLDSQGRPSGIAGTPELNDVVLILKRVLGIIAW